MDFLVDDGDDGNFDDDPELMRELAAIQRAELKRKEKAKKSAPSSSKSQATLDDFADDFNDDDLEAELDALLAADEPLPKQSKQQHHVQKPVLYDEDEISEETPTSSSTAHEISPSKLTEIKSEEKPQPMSSSTVEPTPPPLPTRNATLTSSTVQPPVVPAHNSTVPIQKPAEDVQTKAKNLLIRRRQAYALNAKLALEDQNTEYAKECAETVQMFDQALEACEEQEITMEDLSEIPQTPPPYKKKVAPIKPLATLEDELVARIRRFGELAVEFEQSGDVSRSRMQKRLSDQLKQALVLHRKGRPIKPETLPVPLGFSVLKATEATAAPASLPVPTQPKAAMRSKTPSPAPSTKLTPQEQTEILKSKILEYKKAALLAKKKGDLPAAAKYLQAAKVLEKEVSGRTEPQPKPSTSAAGATAPATTAHASKLEDNLRQQLELIMKLRTQFNAVKDVKRTLFYDELIRKCSSNLKVVYSAAKQGDPLLYYRTHQINLPTLEINPGLAVDVVEVKIKSISDLKLPDGWKPKDAYTFVTFEFPFPHESHQTGKTKTVTGTDNPEFDEAFQLNINRKTRQLQRICQRSPLKLAVYQKGGFLRSDKLCGEANILLGSLINQATLTVKQDLLIQRKKTGGTISVEIRVQKPLDDKKMNTTKPYPWIQLEEHVIPDVEELDESMISGTSGFSYL
ncbi:C2 domain protein [Aphelenchoides besseyi]|nr:C2 domain protein [Aphelenchoides besseyi]